MPRIILKKGFAKEIGLHSKHGITVPDPTALEYTTLVELFSNNKFGMMQLNIGTVTVIQPQNPDVKFGIVLLKWKDYGMTMEGTTFISSSSKHPEAAWELVKILSEC